MTDQSLPKKQVIGLLGEMNVAMVLHELGWQVYRPVIDENIDFVLTRYYCVFCSCFTTLYVNKTEHGLKVKSAVTDRCAQCEKKTVQNIVRFIQVKTSDGIWSKKNIGNFSFHAKLRHHVDPRTFYIWIAAHQGDRIDKKTLCYYVFHHSEVARFDDINLPSYQETDNQKTSLRINSDCEVQNRGRRHSYDCFSEFLDNFGALNEIMFIDSVVK